MSPRDHDLWYSVSRRKFYLRVTMPFDNLVSLYTIMKSVLGKGEGKKDHHGTKVLKLLIFIKGNISSRFKPLKLRCLNKKEKWNKKKRREFLH